MADVTAETYSISSGQARTCKNCKNAFTIEPDDFDFYKKIDVPPPTFCPHTITSETIECVTCGRGFRVVPQELEFLKRENFPLPRRCPFCRIGEKLNQRGRQMKTYPRKCDTCGVEFKTHYSALDASNILCKKCYQAGVV